MTEGDPKELVRRDKIKAALEAKRAEFSAGDLDVLAPTAVDQLVAQVSTALAKLEADAVIDGLPAPGAVALDKLLGKTLASVLERARQVLAAQGYEGSSVASVETPQSQLDRLHAEASDLYTKLYPAKQFAPRAKFNIVQFQKTHRQTALSPAAYLGAVIKRFRQVLALSNGRSVKASPRCYIIDRPKNACASSEDSSGVLQVEISAITIDGHVQLKGRKGHRLPEGLYPTKEAAEKAFAEQKALFSDPPASLEPDKGEE
ncbi:hypothetical protein CO046_00530 [Candidatus Peregrinibacteria bacterium CG_4_9_14_0_2_um_filter_53_11]|nr:MAG: hypothetical protein CO046_00530 [Candidatus Peregrinibacteria bacterium CG_4_9_14_0_2_um_filter_53_11]